MPTKSFEKPNYRHLEDCFLVYTEAEAIAWVRAYEALIYNLKSNADLMVYVRLPPQQERHRDFDSSTNSWRVAVRVSVSTILL